jgi:hypothetical protein
MEKETEEMIFVYICVLLLILFTTMVLFQNTQLKYEVAKLRKENCNLRHGEGNWWWNHTINDCVYTENPPVIREIHL